MEEYNPNPEIIKMRNTFIIPYCASLGIIRIITLTIKANTQA